MKIIQPLTAGLVMLLLAACATTTQPPPTAAPTQTPIPTGIPTQAPTASPSALPTTVPLYRQVTLGTTSFSETGKAPDYTFQTQTPVLQGSTDPRVINFNKGVAAPIQSAIDQFRKDLSNQPAKPIAGGSFFDLRYKLVSPPGNILSLQIQIEGMSDGAAHPYHVTTTYTYDLEKGQVVTFDQLFLPGVNALQTIADYCRAELSKRDIGFDSMFASGADPTPENYAFWNISADGLLIVFNEYQVAPYAAGPQSVTIPRDVLKNIINPDGPLAGPKP